MSCVFFFESAKYEVCIIKSKVKSQKWERVQVKTEAERYYTVEVIVRI